MVGCSGKNIPLVVRQTLISYSTSLSLHFLTYRMAILKPLSYSHVAIKFLSWSQGLQATGVSVLLPYVPKPLRFSDGPSLTDYGHLLDSCVLQGQGLSLLHFSSPVISSVPGRDWSLCERQLHWAAFHCAKESTVILGIWRRAKRLGKKQNRARKAWSFAT